MYRKTFNKNVQSLYTENYKTVLKEIKKMERYASLWVGKNIKTSVLPKLIYIFCMEI